MRGLRTSSVFCLLSSDLRLSPFGPPSTLNTVMRFLAYSLAGFMTRVIGVVLRSLDSPWAPGRGQSLLGNFAQQAEEVFKKFPKQWE